MNDNQNNFFPNGQGGVPPVQPNLDPNANQGMMGGVPGAAPQPQMQQPMYNQMPQQPVQQPMYGQPMQQPMQMGGQPMYGQPMPAGGKKGVPKGFVVAGGVVGALVVGLLLLNTVFTKKLECSYEESNFGVKTELSTVYKTRFGKAYSISEKVVVDYSKSDEADEFDEYYEELKEYAEDYCDKYDSGCSYVVSNSGKKITVSVTYKGEALEDYYGDDEFDDFDEIKENFEDDYSDGTCK